MRYGALLGWGIVIYAIMYLVWSGLVLYGFAGYLGTRVLGLLTLIVVTAIATRSLRVHSWKDALPYSIAWMIVIAALDYLFSAPYVGVALYADWNIWVGYLLVALVPPLFVSMRFLRRE